MSRRRGKSPEVRLRGIYWRRAAARLPADAIALGRPEPRVHADGERGCAGDAESVAGDVVAPELDTTPIIVAGAVLAVAIAGGAVWLARRNR